MQYIDFRIDGYFEVSNCKQLPKKDIFVSLGSINKPIVPPVVHGKTTPACQIFPRACCLQLENVDMRADRHLVMREHH